MGVFVGGACGRIWAGLKMESVMKFEWDEVKSASNKIKHGVNFEEAQLLWEDCDRVELAIQSEGEPRYLTIGLMHNKHWTAIITYRGSNIRLISIRRSRTDEVKIYEN